MTLRPYDRELGKITNQDKEYAADLFGELDAETDDATKKEIIALWFRKVRYEAVMAERKRVNGETQKAHTDER